jgi:hypothetical protein
MTATANFRRDQRKPGMPCNRPCRLLRCMSPVVTPYGQNPQILGQAARGMDENWYCDSGASAWLALLFNREQHFDLYAYSARPKA